MHAAAKNLGRCFLVGLGICIALLVVEGVRRIDNRIRRGIPLLTNPRSMWDERRGWIGREHLLGEASINPILVLGDSFTEGLSVPSEKMWFSYLRNVFPGRQVIAYGGLGYGTLQELVVLEDYLSKGIRPSLVVLQLCSNDIINNYYPLEVLSYSQRPPAPRPYLEEQGVVVRFPRRFGAVLSPIIGLSQFAYALSARWDKATVERAAVDDSDSIEVRLQQRGFSDPDFQKGIQITTTLLTMFKTAAGGVPVVLMLVDDVEPYTSALRDIARKVELPIVVPQRIRPVSIGEKLPDGAHLNENGNRVVAETFLEVAVSRSLMPAEGGAVLAASDVFSKDAQQKTSPTRP